MGQGPFSALHPDAAGAGSPLRVLDGRPMVEAAGSGPPGDPLWIRRGEGPLHLRRQRAQVRGQQDLRGRAAEPRAALARDGLVLGARGAGALSVGDPVRGLRGLPPEARGAGCEDRRQARGRGLDTLHQARPGVVRGAGGPAQRQADGDRPADPEGDQRPAAVPGERGAGLPEPVALVGDAVGRREPADPAGEPDRLGADRRALCAGRAFDRAAPAGQLAPPDLAEGPAGPRQLGVGGGARRGGDPHRRLCDRHGPGGRRAWGPRGGRGAAGRRHGAPEKPDRPVSLWRARDRGAGRPPPDRQEAPEGDRRAGQQPQRGDRRNSGGDLHLHHRGVRRRQIHLHHRDALQGRGAQTAQRLGRPGAARADRGAGELRQGHRHRPVADRAHAAVEPGDLHGRLPADPGLVRRAAGGQGARLRAGAVLVQREGRTLRSLPGRRVDQDRDALPAGRVRDLRRLPRPPLQPRDAGDPVQGQVDRRHPGHDGRGGRGVLQGGAADPREDGDPEAGGSGLHQGGPAGDDAVGRRGAAGEAVEGAVAAGDGEDALHPR